LESAEKKSYKDYYREKKIQSIPKSTYMSGIDEPKGYRYSVPDQPDYPAEDIRSTSYTAEETALANLRIFFSKMYRSMQSSEPYFQQIINNHMLH
jgi:hypothetical protein